MTETTKYNLPDSDLPKAWYNVQADLPFRCRRCCTPAPEAAGPDDLAPLFPMALIQQEVSTERYIEIPEAVRDVYACGGRRRSSAPDGWRRRSGLRPRSTTSTKA